MTNDVIDFEQVRKEKTLKKLENQMLDSLVFDHASQLFPGFKEVFISKNQGVDPSIKVSRAIEEFEGRIREISPELADKYKAETLGLLITFYQQLQEDLGGEFEVLDCIDDNSDSGSDGDSES